ncbi:UNVERIFIED_CONTAM: hypothetical protein Sradi_2487600 [Sesamum radiatum]|uniref:Uncharacterized protein n=1 Tax=Sesamum radiatum TaxID=300843 RepID=A0AAW2SJQ7_SESRA
MKKRKAMQVKQAKKKPRTVAKRNPRKRHDMAGTTTHQQTTLDDIARRIARMEANLIDLFEHVGLTPRRPPTP